MPMMIMEMTTMISFHDEQHLGVFKVSFLRLNLVSRRWKGVESQDAGYIALVKSETE